jgi:hypothetical protein
LDALLDLANAVCVQRLVQGFVGLVLLLGEFLEKARVLLRRQRRSRGAVVAARAAGDER